MGRVMQSTMLNCDFHRVYVWPETMETTVNIKDACLDAAYAIIAEQGLDQLSLREVSRRLNISHQAPYKHFPSKDHLLAEVLSRCFRRFAYALEHREAHTDADDSLRAMGVAYLQFALQHPLEYKLMFGTPWPESAKSDDMINNSLKAFHVLRDALLAIYKARGEVTPLGATTTENTRTETTFTDIEQRAELDAIYIWSVMHGYAMILQCNVMSHMHLAPETLQQAAQHIFAQVRKSLA